MLSSCLSLLKFFWQAKADFVAKKEFDLNATNSIIMLLAVGGYKKCRDQ